MTFAGCFGWLHQQSGGALGVVMCASWEYEAAAIGHSWRVFADRLADAGLPTLRYDYPGCGDSLGRSDAPGAFEAALASIGAAVDTLRAQAGVERVALVGLRLGGALALIAAQTLEIDVVAMIRPVPRGKLFVAEQRAFSRILQVRDGPAVRRDPDPGTVEIEGFRLNVEHLEQIGKIDLAALPGRAPKRVLIAGEPGAAQYDKLAESLAARGAVVTRLDLAETMGWTAALPPPAPPLIDADAVAKWLRADSAAEQTPPAMPALETPTFRESVLAFGANGTLKGILCEPARPSHGEARPVVVFLNAGANSHVGAGRATVYHARGLAERGVPSLRMDILGVGDSAWTAEGPLSAIHHVERTVDVSSAIDALKARDFGSVSLVGICSGGFLAFQGALVDPRVERVVIGNPQFWLPPTEAQLRDPMQGAFGSTSGYAAKLRNPQTWKRLFEGDLTFASVAGIIRELARRAVRRGRSGVERGVAKLLAKEHRASDLLEGLAQLRSRQCETLLVVSDGDPARETLAALLPGRDYATLQGLMRIFVMEGADHAFVMPRTRDEFFALLCGFLHLEEASPAEACDRVAA